MPTTPLIDPAAATSVARAALNDADVEVATTALEPLAWQSIAPTTGYIGRVTGLTTDGRAWSAILKVLKRPGSGWNADWRREADVYASGLLGELPPGITAPRLYAIEDGTDEVRLWLEDVVETVHDWPVARYATAARDLGRLNGAYLSGRPLPTTLTLRSDWLAGWVSMTTARSVATMADPAVLEHELASRAFAAELHPRWRRLYDARGELLAALDRLPQTLCHLDAWRANLIARDTEKRTETVAIDWSLAGLAPAGEELAIFVTGARVWLSIPPEMIGPVETTSFAAYLEGLRDAGWSGSEADIRFAYDATWALWAGAPAPVWASWFARPERHDWLERKFRRPLSDAVDPLADFLSSALDHADAASAAMTRGA